MTNGNFIDLVTCIGIWLLCVEDLLDGERTHGVFPVISLTKEMIKLVLMWEKDESFQRRSPPCLQQDCL